MEKATSLSLDLRPKNLFPDNSLHTGALLTCCVSSYEQDNVSQGLGMVTSQPEQPDASQQPVPFPGLARSRSQARAQAGAETEFSPGATLES